MKPCLETIGQLSELLPEEVFTKCVSERVFVTKHTSILCRKIHCKMLTFFLLNLKKISLF